MSYRNHVRIDAKDGLVLELRERWFNAGTLDECWKWVVLVRVDTQRHGEIFEEVVQEHAGTLASALLVAGCYVAQHDNGHDDVHPETNEVLARVTNASVPEPKININYPHYENTKRGC